MGRTKLEGVSPFPLFKTNLTTFWDLVAERQRVWHRRFVLGEKWPWTSDKILQEFSFTNVYRQLDPGTIYLVNNILEKEESFTNRAFNNILYRIVGRQRTHER